MKTTQTTKGQAMTMRTEAKAEARTDREPTGTEYTTILLTGGWAVQRWDNYRTADGWTGTERTVVAKGLTGEAAKTWAAEMNG